MYLFEVNRNEEMVARLRQVARDVGGENAAMAEDLLLTMNPTPIERDLTRYTYINIFLQFHVTP